MIRIVKNPSALTEADLVGKIVFKENHMNWPGFSMPRLVASVSKSRVNVVSLRTGRDAERGMLVLVGKEGGEESYFALKSVALVCDTIAEANEVLKATWDNHLAMREYERLAKERLAELDGRELEDEPEAGPRP